MDFVTSSWIMVLCALSSEKVRSRVRAGRSASATESVCLLVGCGWLWLVGVCVMIDGALRWMQAIAKGNRERPYLNTRSANNDTLITYSPFAA